MKQRILWGPLLSSILIANVVGVLGTVFTSPAIPLWYEGLIKPSFSPPNWVFGPVWILLYTLMGIAAYLIWKMKWSGSKRRKALGAYAIQLVLNGLWTPLFFGLQEPAWALIAIVALHAMIVVTMILFAKIRKDAMWLMMPYLLWVSFAVILNGAIVFLNA